MNTEFDTQFRLVEVGLRPAFLFQPRFGKDRVKMEQVLAEAKRRHLFVSRLHGSDEDFPFFFITKHPLDVESIQTNEDIGRTLGFQCLWKFDEDVDKYSMIVEELKHGDTIVTECCPPEWKECTEMYYQSMVKKWNAQLPDLEFRFVVKFRLSHRHLIDMLPNLSFDAFLERQNDYWNFLGNDWFGEESHLSQLVDSICISSEQEFLANRKFLSSAFKALYQDPVMYEFVYQYWNGELSHEEMVAAEATFLERVECEKPNL